MEVESQTTAAKSSASDAPVLSATSDGTAPSDGTAASAGSAASADSATSDGTAPSDGTAASAGTADSAGSAASDGTADSAGSAVSDAAPVSDISDFSNVPFAAEAREDLIRLSMQEKYIEKHKRSRSVHSWIASFSKLHTLPIAKRIWIYLACMAGYTALAHVLVELNLTPQFLKEAVGIGCANLVLGLLLVFRTNSAYERWWEGRKAWGQLMNDSRSLSMKVSRYVEIPEKEKAAFGDLVVSFAYALKHHLRDSIPSTDLPGVKPIEELTNAHVPVHIADTMYQIIYKWYRAGFIDSIMLTNLDRHLVTFMDVCGICERIRSTPLALSYRAFIRQGIALNLLAMPLYTSTSLPLYWSIPLTIIASYFLIGLEMIAEEIEDPFGHDTDDLPLDTICERICITVHEIMRRKTAEPKSNDVLKYTKSYPTPKFSSLT